jgi:hypothetical protein
VTLNVKSNEPIFASKRQFMEISETVQCPYCGQSFDLAVDTSTTRQTFTVDCEICCRPMEVFAECEPGEILNLEVREG